MKRLAMTIMTVLAAAALAGCAATPAATPQPTSGATGLGIVDNIEQLRDAYIAAGGACDWEQSEEAGLAVASGRCSDDALFSTYENRAKRDEAILVVGLFQSQGLTLLAGENWIINAPAAEAMQSQLGGEWITELAAPTAPPTEALCETFTRSSAAYREAVVDADFVALSGLAPWADDLERNAAPGYTEIVAGYIKPIRQAVEAQSSSDTATTLDLDGFTSGSFALSASCIPGGTAGR